MSLSKDFKGDLNVNNKYAIYLSNQTDSDLRPQDGSPNSDNIPGKTPFDTLHTPLPTQKGTLGIIALYKPPHYMTLILHGKRNRLYLTNYGKGNTKGYAPLLYLASAWSHQRELIHKDQRRLSKMYKDVNPLCVQCALAVHL